MGNTHNLRGKDFSGHDLRGVDWSGADLRAGEVRTLIEARAEIQHMTFAPDGRYLAATGVDGWMRIWSTRTWDIGYESQLSEHTAHPVAFSPDGSLLAIGGIPGGLVRRAEFPGEVFQVWTVGTWKPLWRKKTILNSMSRVEFTAADRLAVKGRRFTNVVTTVWDTTSRSEVDRREEGGLSEGFDPDVDGTAHLSVHGPYLRVRAQPRRFRFTTWDDTGEDTEDTEVRLVSTSVAAVAVGPAGDFVVTGGLCGIWVWSAADGWTGLPGPKAYASHLAVNPAGTLVAGVVSSTVVVWDPYTAKVVAKMTAEGWYHSVAFSPDGATLAANGKSGVELWDTTHWRSAGSVRREHLTWPVVGYAQDGTLLAAAGDNVYIHVWRGDDHITVPQDGSLVIHTYPLAFTPDAATMAVGVRGAIQVWDLATRNQTHLLDGYRRQVHAVAFAPGGTVLAGAGDDRVIRLWDTATGQPVRSLAGHVDAVHDLAFSRDGTLVSGGGDGVRIWDVGTGTCRSHLFAGGATASWPAAGLCRFEPGELDAFRRAPRST